MGGNYVYPGGRIDQMITTSKSVPIPKEFHRKRLNRFRRYIFLRKKA